MKKISISLNDEIKKVPCKCDIAQFIELQTQLKAGAKFAVALNGEFVAKSRYQSTHLSQGDELDIVIPIGGG